MDILIDFAYNNCIYAENNDSYIIFEQLEHIFLQYDCNFNIFIVSHPGSYTGIRKALVLSIIQLYCDRIIIYELNFIEYFKTFANNVGIVINKHIWYSIDGIEKVTSINNIPENIQICNQKLAYECKIIDLNAEYLWNNRYNIFNINKNIIYPKYFDIFSKI